MSFDRPLAFTYAESALAVGADAPFTIPAGTRAAEITLTDAAIGFTVQLPGVTARMAIPAGGSYVLPTRGWPTNVAIVLQLRSLSGTPTAVAEYASGV